MTNSFNEFLEKKHINVFSVNDAARIIGKPPHYTTIFLSRNKNIRRAARGVYYVRNADEYEIASSIVYQSYISLISALRFHNLTDQMPNIIYVLSDKRHAPISNLSGYSVKFIKIRKDLMEGYSRIDGAFVADPEKAVVDMLYLNMFTEYAEEAVETGKLDANKLIKYAQLTGKRSIINRIGGLLGKRGHAVAEIVMK
jgi:predicted transcriptional regulator of viral defense system